VELAWTAVDGAEQYQVWRAVNNPYFSPPLDAACSGPAGCMVVPAVPGTIHYTYADPVLGDPAANHTYLVRPVAACGAVAAVASRVGEFEFGLIPGQ
jgi:hypothetical protein